MDYGLDFPNFFLLLFSVIYNHELNNVIHKDLLILLPFDMVNYCTYSLCCEHLSPFHRVYRVWQFPISGVRVHSIMMENQPWLVRVGVHDCPLSLCLPSRTKLQCTLQLRDRYTAPYFISTLYVLCAPFYRYLISSMVELMHVVLYIQYTVVWREEDK